MGLLLDGSSWVTSTVQYNRPSTNHTVMYWLRLDNSSTTRRPFGHTAAWEARTVGTVLTSDYLQSGDADSEVTMTVGTWHHIAFVQNVTGSQRLAYRDGQLVQTNNGVSFAGAQIANLSLGTTAGNQSGQSTQGWVGAIEDIRVYDTVVTASEMETIHACRGTDGIFDNLSLWFKLNEGNEGDVVTDELISQGTAGFGAPTLNTVTGSPRFNYDCGVKYRRRT